MGIISRCVRDTIYIGKKTAKNLKGGDVICLFGQLGSGKTVFTKGIAQGLGIEKDTVISPSFVLLRQYNKGRLPFFHFDLYRLKNPTDILALGSEEYLYGDGVTVIEWAERLGYLLPKEHLGVELFIRQDSQRLLKFKAKGRRYEELLEKLNENIRH